MQVVSIEADDVTALVDFAHTDDALRGLLEAVRGLARGRVITVFGCGGDRDTTKRPLMGSVAARLSDFVVVTSDNPRSEDPEQIVRDIESGLGSPGDSTQWVTVLDRAEAITKAIRDPAVRLAGLMRDEWCRIAKSWCSGPTSSRRPRRAGW